MKTQTLTRHSLLLTGLLAAATAAAMEQGTMDHGAMNHDAMGHSAMAEQSQKMFLEKRDINGYAVSFHVMQASDGMNHGGSHNLMIKVEQGGAPVEGIQINSKVKFADGKEQSKMPMKMGDWYTAGYDLGAAGTHQLMVLFKTADGNKHFGGVHYAAE